MFSKVSKFTAKSPFYTQKRGIRSIVLDYFQYHDAKNKHVKAATFNPLLPLEGHQSIVRPYNDAKFQTTKLKNGITVVTENAPFPSVVDIGILLDVGTRDETKETSGALLSIKNTYFKTVLNTNEAVNYGMVQMSGGDFFMDYDQEGAYFSAHCLSHDVVDIFNMMADCAVEPRSAVASDLGIFKNQETHKLEDYLQTGAEFHDKAMQIAYDEKTLGMPLTGKRGNVVYLNAHVMQKFQLENINPSKIYVCAAGLENHQEFVDLVENKLGFIPPADSNFKQREVSKYVGGEVRTSSESNDLHAALLFESVPWKDNDMFTFNVINTLLGQSINMSRNAHGRGINSRLNKNLAQKHHFIDSATALNFHFTDSGIFGIHVCGSASNGTEIVDAITGELKDLTKSIPADELQRAKNTLKNYIYSAMEKQSDRLEEAVKNVKLFGDVQLDKYYSEIDKVTGEQINKAIAKIIAKNPTFVAKGGHAHTLPSLDKIKNSLKL